MELQGVDLVGGVAEVDIAKFLRTLHPAGVFEIRALNCPDRVGGTFKSTASGYFNNHEVAGKEAIRIDNLKPSGVYCTLCTLQPVLLARANNRIQLKSKETANDTHALRRTNLFIDIDADKMAGVSSTDAEMRAAIERALSIRERLTELGWPQPIFGMSGNGASLHYRIDLEATEDTRQLVSRLYEKLGSEYGLTVDKSVINASRLTKLLGTMARKGDELRGVEGLEDRIHRRSWYILPESYDVLPYEQIVDIAGEATLTVSHGNDSRVDDDLVQDDDVFREPELPAGSTFDIDQWIREHNVPVGPRVPWSGGSKYVFTELPVLCQNSPSGHTDIAACIYVHGSGAVSASCSHERCNWEWKDLRQHYEPEAYKLRIAVQSQEIDKADDRAALASSKAKFEEKRATKAKQLLIDLNDFMNSWKIERILGDENIIRLSGPFFYSESSDVKYFEIDFDTLYSFTKFNIALGKWRTGKNCILPQAFGKVWNDAIGALLNRAVNVEGGIEYRVTSQVADRLVFIIKNYAKPISFLADPDRRAVNEYGFKGVLIRQIYGETQYLIDFSKTYKTLSEEHNREIRPKDLTQVLQSVDAKRTSANALPDMSFKSINLSQLEQLRKIACKGDVHSIIEISEGDIPDKRTPTRFDSDADELEDGDDSFEFGGNVA